MLFIPLYYNVNHLRAKAVPLFVQPSKLMYSRHVLHFQ